MSPVIDDGIHHDGHLNGDPRSRDDQSRFAHAHSDLQIFSNRLPASRFDAATCSRGGSCLKVIGEHGRCHHRLLLPSVVIVEEEKGGALEFTNGGGVEFGSLMGSTFPPKTHSNIEKSFVRTSFPSVKYIPYR